MADVFWLREEHKKQIWDKQLSGVEQGNENRVRNAPEEKRGELPNFFPFKLLFFRASLNTPVNWSAQFSIIVLIRK